MEIVFATQNQHKIREIQEMMGEGIRLLSLPELGITEEIPEPFPSLEENALAKARYVFSKSGKACFADDTGLEITALGNAPGVLSARYASERGPFRNQEESFLANIHKALENLSGITDRRARFRTVIALVMEGREMLFEGEVRGEILEHPKGNGGFGYDPVFQPEGSVLSFAEMPLAEKNKISHRARAFTKLHVYLGSLQKEGSTK